MLFEPLPPRSWLTRSFPSYPRLVAFVVAGVLFAHIGEYLFARHDLPPPLYWIAAFGLLSAPLALARLERLELPVLRLSLFVFAFLSLVVLGWLNSDGGGIARQAARTAVMSGLTILLFAVLFDTEGRIRAARVAVLVMVLVAVIANIYEIFAPGTFNDSLGRSAGLYINPNNAGFAIVSGAIVTLPIVRRKWREWLMFAAGLGALATVSRAAVLVWLVGFCMTAALLRFSLARVTISVAVLALGALLSANLFESPVLEFLGDDADFAQRFEFFSSGGLEDGSSRERELMLLTGWQKFLQHPLWGWGIGSSYEQVGNVLGRETGVHNMYLNHILEYGIMGIAIVPAMAALMIWNAVGIERRIGFALAAVFLVWALFDHNVLDAPSKLLIFALQAAAAARSSGYGEGPRGFQPDTCRTARAH